MTDANVALGRIQPAWFPRVFGSGGDEPLDADLPVSRFADLARRITADTGDQRSGAEVAAGFLDIAVANMANAIKKISVQRGYDITRYVLATFGGAGGQHACAVADALGMTSVLIHPLAGVLSAYGMGLADVTLMREAAVEEELSGGLLGRLDQVAGDLEAEGRAELAAEGLPGGGPPGGGPPGGGLPGGGVSCVRRAQLRYQGTDTALPVPLGAAEAMMAAFEAAYRQRFSFLMRDKPVVVESVSVELTGGAGVTPDGSVQPRQTPAQAGPHPAGRVRMFTGGRWAEVDLRPRAALRPGQVLAGPALITEDFATTVVEPGWQAAVTGRGDLLLTRPGGRPLQAAAGTGADPVMLEIFNNLFMSVAEQMGVRLQSTAHSVNIKERLDFSCAIFDAAGQLIANAPHMPVHLGSMGESIKMIISRNPGAMRPGDVFMLNDPYHGGTHLPDITVVTPVFSDDGRRILFFVASRGHHAEIGGITPGSMPAFSTRVDEEGVLIDNWRLAGGGEMRESATTELLTSAEFPSRNPGANLADLRAQIAANEKGAAELRQLVSQFGLDVVTAYMGHVQDNAEEAVRRVIARLRDGECAYETGQRRRDQGGGAGGPAGPDRGDRLHRHLRAAPGELQRALVGRHGRGPVRAAHPGGRRDPAERRLPQAGPGHHPARLPARPGLPGGGGGRQRGDVPGGDRGAVRRARRHGRGVRHHEQRHVRQRGIPVLRDRGERLRCRGRVRGRPGGPDAHDQLPADRPGGAGVAFPGPAGVVRDPPGQWRRGPVARW